MNQGPWLGQVPIRNLGQGYDIPAAKKLLRKYCSSMEYYEGLAVTDPSFAGTAKHYREMCEAAQASLTRMINWGLQQQGIQAETQQPRPTGQVTPGAIQQSGFTTARNVQEMTQSQYNLTPPEMRPSIPTGGFKGGTFGRGGSGLLNTALSFASQAASAFNPMASMPAASYGNVALMGRRGRGALGTKEGLPGVDPVTTIDPSGRSQFSSPGPWLPPPNPDCVFIGYKQTSSASLDVPLYGYDRLSLESNLANARAHGFTEIQEFVIPPCDLGPEASQWERMIRPGCGVNAADKAIWACPGPDYEKLTAEGKAAVTQGCEFLFASEGYLDSQEKMDRIKAEIAAGNKVKRILTGVILNAGSKSQQYEAEIWVCRRLTNVLPAPTAHSGAAPIPAPSTQAPAAKSDLVPVAAGAGVVAIIAALVAGAAGK